MGFYFIFWTLHLIGHCLEINNMYLELVSHVLFVIMMMTI